VLDRLLADGYHISATPALAYSPPHQAAIKRTPLDRILLETDSPVTYQGKISEPADLLTTLHQVSDLKKNPRKRGGNCYERKRTRVFRSRKSVNRHRKRIPRRMSKQKANPS